MTEPKANLLIHPKNFPGPKGFGFLRYVPGLFRKPLETLTKISIRFGKMIPFIFANEELYFINDPGLIQHILKTNYINYQRRNTLLDILPLLGNGIFASNHEYWVGQRKILNTAFHSKMMENYVPEVHKQVNDLIISWEKQSYSGSPVDIQYEMKILLFSILIKSMFSENVKYNAKSIINSLDIILQHASIKNHTIKIIRKHLFKSIGLPKQNDEKFLNEIRKLDEFVYQMIEEGIKGKISICGVLGTLIEEFKGGRTDKIKIRDEIMTFLFAGFDTVAETLTWAFYSIAENPDVGEKLVSELKDTLNGDKPDFTNVNSLTYTKKILDETLRLYPAAWAIFRITTEDDEYEDLKIPARSYLMISPYTQHRKSAVWDEPELFNPDRFDGIKISDLPMMGYIPFGDGPHVCIGKKLAVLQAQIIIGMLAQKFKFHLVTKKKPEIVPGIIMKAKNNILLRLEII